MSRTDVFGYVMILIGIVGMAGLIRYGILRRKDDD